MKEKSKLASSLLEIIEEYSYKTTKEQLRGYVQFLIGTIVNIDIHNGRAKVRYIDTTNYNKSSHNDIQVTIKTIEKLEIGDNVLVIYVNNLTNAFLIAKMSSSYYTNQTGGANGGSGIASALNKYLLKSGGAMYGPLIIAGGIGGGIIFPANGTITIEGTKDLLLGVGTSGVTVGNKEKSLNLYGLTTRFNYNDKEVALKEDIPVDCFSKYGGDIEGSIYFKNSPQIGLYWNSKTNNPFIGYPENNNNDSFIVSSIEGTNFANGLAIDGTTKELYWKNQKVATETELDLKVDKEDGKGLSSNDFTNEYKEQLDSLGENLQDKVEELTELIETKVDKVKGKELSSNDFTDGYKAQLDALDNNIQEQVDDLTNLISTKQDKKPDGTNNLINSQTGKIDNAYIPTGIGGGRTYAGTFQEDGIIQASVYASKLNGQNINDIDRNECVGYEFTYFGEGIFLLGRIAPSGGSADNATNKHWELNNGDTIICNGNLQWQSWTLVDNSDKVISVNGQTGAVQIELNNYLPLTAGINKKITGDLYTTKIIEGENALNQKYRSLFRNGSSIPENANLNTIEFAQVGIYGTSNDTLTATLINCPTSHAFIMEVLTPLDSKIRDVQTTTWCYVVRKILTYQGEEFIQRVYSQGVAGELNYGTWQKISTNKDLENYLPLTGGTLSGQLVVDEIKSNTSNAVKIMSNNNTSPQAACLYSNVPGSCTFAMYGGVEGGNGNSLLGGFGIKDKVPVFYDFLTSKELALKEDIPDISGITGDFIPLDGSKKMTGALNTNMIQNDNLVCIQSNMENSNNMYGMGAFSSSDNVSLVALGNKNFNILGALGVENYKPVFYNAESASLVKKELALKTDATATITAASFKGRLAGTDTRAVNSLPSDYQQSQYTISEYQEFKTASTIGAPNANSKGFVYLKTFNPWGDSSGGLPVQLAFGTGIAFRQATSSSEWGPWETLGGSADLASKADRNNSSQTITTGTLNVNTINIITK